MTLEEIQKAIAGLTPDELARFRVWFERFDAFHFKKTESHGAAERPDGLADAALADDGEAPMPRLITGD